MRPLPSASELLKQAAEKRETAARLRKMSHGMSLPDDRSVLIEHAAALEREADRLEAEARGQARVIDAKSELERRKLMNVADGEKMQMEAGILKQNPLLIQKIIAEKLSDKVQIMMVPSDGKFFFANDVLRGGVTPAVLPNQ